MHVKADERETHQTVISKSWGTGLVWYNSNNHNNKTSWYSLKCDLNVSIISNRTISYVIETVGDNCRRANMSLLSNVKYCVCDILRKDKSCVTKCLCLTHRRWNKMWVGCHRSLQRKTKTLLAQPNSEALIMCRHLHWHFQFKPNVWLRCGLYTIFGVCDANMSCIIATEMFVLHFTADFYKEGPVNGK